MANEAASLTRTLQAHTIALAVGVDAGYALVAAPFAGTVTAVTYTTPSAITGADTNSRTVAVVNKGTAGAGSTSVASLALASGVNTVAYVPKAVTLSVTAANLVVAAGDVLAFTSTHVGTGIADTGGLVTVTISRTEGA